MYNLLSIYYDKLFEFNPKFKDFLFPYATKSKEALDLGSGTGRLTHVINELGMHVTGIDLNHNMIEVAKKNFPDLNFETKDLLEYIGYPSQKLDLITCFGNTIAHLDHDSVNQLFNHVHLYLNKNKFFVVQILNYTKILREKPDSLPDLMYDNLLLKRNYIYYKDHIIYESILFKDDDVYPLGSKKLFPHTHMALMDIALQYGFECSFYGKPDFSSYQYNDSHVYIVFKKI